jgi:hypothetical protein
MLKFDVDDAPPIEQDGAEEHDRELGDDYDTACVSSGYPFPNV